MLKFREDEPWLKSRTTLCGYNFLYRGQMGQCSGLNYTCQSKSGASLSCVGMSGGFHLLQDGAVKTYVRQTEDF